MNRDRALAELTACSLDIRAHGVRALYLFGSTARDAARDGSDVDIFIEADPATRFNAFDLIYSIKGALAGPNFATDILGTFFYRTFFGYQLQIGSPTMGATVATMAET